MARDLRRTAAAVLGLATTCLTQNLGDWAIHHWAGPRIPGWSKAVFDAARGRTLFLESGTLSESTPTWEWDGTEWHDRGPLPTLADLHEFFDLAYDPVRQRAVLFGGKNGVTNVLRPETWEWDGSTWIQVSGVGPTARSEHAMVFHALTNRIILFGGRDATGDRGDTWAWDGSSWTQIGFNGPLRSRHDMVYDSQRSRIVMFGGRSNNVSALGDTWEWNGSGWLPQFSAIGPPPRRFPAMAYDAVRGVTVMTGGEDPSNPGLEDVWEWDGSSWVQRSGTTPFALLSSPHVAAYEDPTTGRARFIAADKQIDASGSTYDGIWEWDGSSWRRQTPWVPRPRRGTALTFDRARQRTVMFGGYQSGGTSPPEEHFGDTWEYDGARWRKVGGGGPARREHTLSYDPMQSRSLLFGGRNGTTLFNDVWSWDGITWTDVSPAGTAPPPRTLHAAAFDSNRQKLVVFGGWDLSQALGDTWEWDGSSWTQVAATGPPRRVGHTMAFDENRGVIVMCGGSHSPVSGSSHKDTWEWDGSSWSQRPSAVDSRRGHELVYDSDHQQVVLVGGWMPQFPPRVLAWDGNTWQVVWQGPWNTRFIYPGAAYDRALNKIVVFGTQSTVLRPDQTYLFRRGVQGSATSYGNGCGAPALTMAGDPANPPILGSSADALITNVPTSLAFVSLGTSRTTFGQFVLPLPLSGFGLSGCNLLQSTEGGSAPAASTGIGTATFRLALPNANALLSLQVYLQAFAIAPGQNPAGVILSNGVAYRLGSF